MAKRFTVFTDINQTQPDEPALNEIEPQEIDAYHESGHATIAYYLGGRVNFATIEPDWDEGPDRSGEVQIQWPPSLSSRQVQEKSVLVSLAGPVAEMIYTGNAYHPGMVAEWAQDWRQAWHEAASLVAEDRRRLAFLEQTTAELHRVINGEEMWAAIAAMADHLLAHETVEGEEMEAIVGLWLNQIR